MPSDFDHDARYLELSDDLTGEAEYEAMDGKPSSVMKAILALLFELRRQDIGAEIAALTAAVRDLNRPPPG